MSGCEWFQKLTSSLQRCGVGVIVDSRKGFTQTLFGPNEEAIEFILTSLA